VVLTPNPKPLLARSSEKRRPEMGDRMQRLKGKGNEAVGKTKGTVGYKTGSGKTELKGDAQRLKGETQQAVGKAGRGVKRATR
jgi:uncharacterized protein YjbJ (UPF0337 family)